MLSHHHPKDTQAVARKAKTHAETENPCQPLPCERLQMSVVVRTVGATVSGKLEVWGQNEWGLQTAAQGLENRSHSTQD